MDNALYDFLDDISAVRDLHELKGQISHFLKSVGFDRFTYVGFNPLSANPRAAEMSTFPVDWVQHYVDNRYVYIDPTILMARHSLQPFTWDHIDSLEILSKQQKQINLEARDFGIAHMISVPIHGRGNEFGLLVGKSMESDRAFAKSLPHQKHTLHLVGLGVHTAVQNCLMSDETEIAIQLSQRETECLLWTARGKTAWEIGEILSISERTVNEYIGNAARKLGCHQKTLAVTKAIIGRHIAP